MSARRQRQSADGPMSWAVLTLAASLLLAFVAAIYATFVLTRPTPFDPLRSVTPQTVTSRVPGVKGPAARLDDPVRVIGTKCNISGDPVPIRGRIYWIPVYPSGPGIRTGGGVSTLPVGCKTFRFANVIPDVVIRQTRDLYTDGYRSVRWRIAGEMLPLAHDDPVERGYYTQSFRLLPKR